MKGLSHTLLPLCAAELDLRKGGSLLLKNIHPVRNARATAQLPHQKKGLVESSFSQALLMKNGRAYEALLVQKSDQTTTVYFDITEYLGKGA